MIGTCCVVYEKERGTVKTREPLIYCSLAVVRRQRGVNATIYDYRALFSFHLGGDEDHDDARALRCT